MPVFQSKSVAGIAMGLIKEGEKCAILTDIQGLEDHYGDMDFKVAGTCDGVTALQMDNKRAGLPGDIGQALGQAKRGRLQILEIMDSVIERPRDELSQYAPRIYTMNIDPEKIRDVIGPGGKTIKYRPKRASRLILKTKGHCIHCCFIRSCSKRGHVHN